MTENVAARAEEAAFLADMPAVLGPRAMAALAAINAALGLGYAGVDFGLAPERRRAVLRSQPRMVLQSPGPDPIWDYRRAPIRPAPWRAVKALLIAKAAAKDFAAPGCG